MEADTLFLNRYKEMEKLSEQIEGYELVKLAAILRQLFCDEHPLVHLVNTNRLRLTFEVTADEPIRKGALKPSFTLKPDGINPYHHENTDRLLYPRAIVSLNGFLDYVLVEDFVKNQKTTVRTVIGYTANVQGGVHFSPKPRLGYKFIHGMSGSLLSPSGPVTTYMLRSIAKVAVRGLRPLVEDVRRREATAKQSTDATEHANSGKVARNARCPCGSGKRFKHCHGAI